MSVDDFLGGNFMNGEDDGEVRVSILKALSCP